MRYEKIMNDLRELAPVEIVGVARILKVDPKFMAPDAPDALGLLCAICTNLEKLPRKKAKEVMWLIKKAADENRRNKKNGTLA